MTKRRKGTNGKAPVVSPPTRGPRGLGEWLRMFRKDVDAAFEHDPAARNKAEVVLTYPGLHAIWMHRIAHHLYRRGSITRARLVSHANRFVTGVEIHPGATIGTGIFIDHGMGVVIGETAVVGDNCLIYKGVVLGGTTLERTDRHPRLGRGVVVGTNACVLGAIEIGDGARVGSGSVVIRDVPDHSTVVGVPGRVVSDDLEAEHATMLDHADLPDPIVDLLRDVTKQIDRLRHRLDAYEAADEGTSQSAAERDDEGADT